MNNEGLYLFLIIIPPLIGFIINFLFSRCINNKLSSLIASLSVLLSFVFSILNTIILKKEGKSFINQTIFWWINQDFIKIPIKLYLDSLSAIMTLIVTGIGFLIHVYSISYMRKDKDFKRFFSYLNLFIFFMLLLVLSDNLIITFFGWEGVGLCSYLLIGFWYENIENSKAAKKAFIVNRIGDAFFIAAIVICYFLLSSAGIYELSYIELNRNISYLINSTILGIPSVFLITFFLFLAACGKSAQFPLYVWLPDAMAGPTPVSALIHAATMVTAGIYLIARLFVLYSYSTLIMNIIIWVSAITSLISAIIAIGQKDIKKILAYSTISQLGYMFMGLASGNYQASMFHLTTHAFFKALLFLSAGAIIHSLGGVQDIFKMGDLKNNLKNIFYITLIGSLAIIGFPYTSGYYSKDLIIEYIYLSGNKTVWFISLIVVFLTAFYMTRMFVIVFIKKNNKHIHLHHKPDKIMIFPLYILALFSLTSGYFGKNFFEFLETKKYDIDLPHLIKYAPIFFMSFGVVSSYLIYTKNLNIKLKILSNLVYNKFYVDEMYEKLIIKPLTKFAYLVFKYIDRKLIDNILIEGLGSLFISISKKTSKMENSNTHFYVTYLLLTLSAFIIFIFIKGVK
ncbi:MAG: NADH-quinone oxidoreductase subunit L [Candidatus Goldbacteria bacterium]|nr:NADH-quinone oxidoreductase subunit L [Candidatus Goldiibacteriota bacterium]